MTAPAPLVLTGVHKALAGTPVLRQVTFECPAGAVTALLGPNGAGKTTSVAVATGLRGADAGQVRIFGKPVRDRASRRRFSLVPQEIGLPAAVTVRRCLDFVAGQRAPSTLAPAPTEICERLGVTTVLERRAGGLSGGQQRKVAVALGLLRVPGLLIMDEATTNLDETARATTWQLVREYTDRGGAALVTSHILADIDSHADRVVALSEGRVVLQSPLEQVRTRLGGSVVSVRLPRARQVEVVGHVRALLPGAMPSTHPNPPGARQAPPEDAAVDTSWSTLEWRSRQPLPLVAAIAQIAPEAADLVVRPIPLGELLTELAGGASP